MKVEEKPFKCAKCGRGFKEDRYLKTHLAKKVPCDKKFNRYSYKRHLNSKIHKKNEEEYKPWPPKKIIIS